jgi:IS1 family transposase
MMVKENKRAWPMLEHQSGSNFKQQGRSKHRNFIVALLLALVKLGGSTMSNYLKQEKKIAILKAQVEGNSIRSTERMTGVHRDTIMRLLLEVGENCQNMLDKNIKHVDVDSIQCDEIWTFVAKKQRRLTDREKASRVDEGDEYVFVALDADSKLAISYLVGKRDRISAQKFIDDLGSRLNGNRVQISSDGFESYAEAIERKFGNDVDYSQIIKQYAAEGADRSRYSPPRVSTVIKETIIGHPDDGDANTAYVERQNLTMRMCMRRFTRLTNAFSKKLRNLKAAVALHFAYYNFCRVHQSLRMTPAMKAGLTDHVWEIEELLNYQPAMMKAA